MSTTKKRLAEQIQELVKGIPTHIREIEELIGQSINSRLKLSHLNETMAAGERIPNGTMLATYENLPVVSYATRSKAILPAFPISLPRDVGMYQVVPYITVDGVEVPNLACEYVPVPAGQMWMIQKDGLLSVASGTIGYERYGLDLLFSQDVTKLPEPVTKVMVRMAISDISKINEFEPLPIPIDMEFLVIQDVYQIITGKKLTVKKADPVAENGGN